MNRIYQSTWNNTTGTFVAVSEATASAGKKSSPGASIRVGVVAGNARFALKTLAISLMVAFGANAFALPVGGVVAQGGASISSAAGSTTIVQSSQNVAINWQSFSIGTGEAVRFVQPGSSAVALNRVLGPDPSSILGNLSANGKVFLVNPNGILFARGAQVNVGGLVAATLNITDSDFMAGRYRFAGSSDAAVLNQGTIDAAGGYVALMGASVGNDGLITARLGTVALAAGNAMTIDVAGDGLVNVTVSQGAVDALARNGGLIQADGGHVLMTSKSAGLLLSSAVNNTGVIQAQTIENRNGTIMLMGDMQSGTVNVGGKLDVSGTDAGQTGGSVAVTGHHAGMFDGHIDASGDTGGGTILIGGGYQGKSPAVPNASATYMSRNSTIAADAISNGNGGTVVLWADDATRAYGSITTRGGAQGGNGGLIETSGHWLDVAGINIGAGAPNGKSGTWLLDPANVIISGAATSGATLIGNVFAPNANVNDAIVNAGDLQATLNGGTDVTITTTNTGAAGTGAGDITVNSALTWGTVPGVTLTLNAANDVIINFAMTASTAGDKMVLTAGNDVKVLAALVASAINTRITLTAGNDVAATFAVTATGLGAVIDMSAGHNVSVAAVTADGGGAANSVILRANNDVLVNNAVSAAGGNVLLRADSDGTGPGLVAGTVKFVAPGSVVASTNTAIRFNPNGYPATTGEITAYDVLVTGVLDAKAWVFAKGNDKVYNGNTTAILSLNGSPTGVTMLPGTANFTTKDVGVNKPINFSGYTTGGNVAEYLLWSSFGGTAGSGTTSAAVTQAPLTLKADNATKVYGQTFTPLATAFTVPVLPVTGETVTGVTETSTGSAAGATVAGSTYPIVITPGSATGSGGFLQSNYTITYNPGILTVTPAPLAVTADPKTKVYGTTDPALTYTTGAFQAGDTAATVLTGALSRAAGETVVASPYAIGQGSLASNGNYTVAYTAANLVITPKPLTGNITAADKVFDATTAATITGRTLTGVVGADAVTYTGGTATFDTAAVGAGKTVTGTGLGLSGADGGNYTVNPTAVTTAAITAVVVPPPPPLVTTPIETTPIETTPIETAGMDAEEMMGPESILGTTAGWPVTVVRTSRPAELLALLPPAVPEQPLIALEPAPVIVPAEAPPQIYAPPLRPRKQDRN